MINKLRKKFIASAMLSVVLVLGILLTAINVFNYVTVDGNLEERMELLVENGGNFMEFKEKLFKPSDKPDEKMEFEGDPFRGRRDLGEAPFDSRYFSVTFESDGTISDIDIENIFAIDKDEAREMAQKAYDKNRIKGYDGDYKYRLTFEGDTTKVIFLDGGRELSTTRNFLFSSLVIAGLGIIAVFGLVVVLSSIVMRPVAESYAKQKRFITDASHEIKTPLAIIEANTEVIEMESGESEWTKSISNQIRRLSSLTEKLVLLSRMDEENYRQDMTDIELVSLIRDVCESYTGVCEAKEKTLDLDLPERAIYYGNSENIGRMLSLLIDNAIKYSSDKALISIKMTVKNSGGKRPAGSENGLPRGAVKLTLSNPVDEIACGDLDVLFERFYRSDESRSSGTGGHGIGLSVVAAIVRGHKGKIHARSEDGRSICFNITL